MAVEDFPQQSRMSEGSYDEDSELTLQERPAAPTLLVVDDEPAVRRVLVMRLQLAGYRVVCAEDGDEALAVFHREQPDLVVLDVMLPKLCRSSFFPPWTQFRSG
jgi:DNA-binding NtrC family response regulator